MRCCGCWFAGEVNGGGKGCSNGNVSVSGQSVGRACQGATKRRVCIEGFEGFWEDILVGGRWLFENKLGLKNLYDCFDCGIDKEQERVSR